MKGKQPDAADKAKPQGNTDRNLPNSPDVKAEEWSAEEIAEQAVHKDGAEVKEELKQGKKTQN